MSIYRKIALLVPVMMLPALAACATDIRTDLTDAKYTWRQVGHPSKSMPVRVLDKKTAGASGQAQPGTK